MENLLDSFKFIVSGILTVYRFLEFTTTNLLTCLEICRLVDTQIWTGICR